MQGGYTFYGQEIGILMLETRFPRIKGDMGNAQTFPFPVRYKVVKNLFFSKKLTRDADKVLLNSFVEAARELEKEGCKAITTPCGFLAGFQRELADAVHVPVFTTTLELVPMVASMIGRDRQIGIFTERREFMVDSLFEKAGWSSQNYNVCVSDLPDDSIFNKLVIYDSAEGDVSAIGDSVREMTKEHMKQYPDTGAIILECQNFSPFADLIHEESGVPVFGMNQLVEFIAASVGVHPYGR